MRREEIARLLPEVFQPAIAEGTPLSSLLVIMEQLHAPTQQTLAEMEVYFSPFRAPERSLPVLAYWLDLERLFMSLREALEMSPASGPPLAIAPGRLRELIANASHLSQWRGTAHGLTLFLELASGCKGFVMEEAVPGPDGNSRPFHVRIRAPQSALRHRALLERIIEYEKPAYVSHELIFETNSSDG